MITGARRAEVCGLRWPHLFLDDRCLIVSRTVVNRGRDRREKDTKSHQARRVALDDVTASLLAEHRTRCEERATMCETVLRPDAGCSHSARTAQLHSCLTQSPTGSRAYPTASGPRDPSVPCATTPPPSFSPGASTSAPSPGVSVTPAAGRPLFVCTRTSCRLPTSAPPNCSPQPCPHPASASATTAQRPRRADAHAGSTSAAYDGSPGTGSIVTGTSVRLPASFRFRDQPSF